MKTTANMNNTQKFTLNEVVASKTRRGHYMVKELEVNGFDYSKDVQVCLVVGSEHNDMFDKCYMFFIGPRGGLFYFNENHKMVRCDRWQLKSIY